MESKNIKKSWILKTICFLLIPLFAFAIFISAFSMFYVVEYPEMKTANSYFDTNAFSSLYKSNLTTCSQTISKVKARLYRNYGDEKYVDEYLIQKNEDSTIFYTGKVIYPYDSNFRYLVFNTSTGEAYTNLERTARTDTIEKIKEEIAKGGYHWNYKEGQIDTNIKGLSIEDLKYKMEYEDIAKNDYEVYTSINTDLENSDNFFEAQLGFKIFKDIYKASYFLLPISVVIEIVMCLYLLFAVGHTKKSDDITLNYIDKIPLGILGFLACIVYTIEICFAVLFYEVINISNLAMALPFALMIYIIAITTIYLLGSIIKRFKAKTFLKNTILYLLYRFLKKRFGKLWKELTYNINYNVKIGILYFGFLIISFILILLTGSLRFLGLCLLLAFWGMTFWYLLKRMNEFNCIKEAIKNIYEGKIDINLHENELKGVLKELAVYVNDIAGGFSNAVEESLKSERLKTELITNVSHDIKTPLTSIINYVDLLKQENIENEKAKEYLEVLDNKSQRLKKLIEDLVEASKASSGNIKLNKEILNLKELIKQVTGEFEDRFQKRGLEIIFTFPEEDIPIYADGRYMYRVIENLYGNIAKYALDNSRVYVDMIRNGKDVLIAIKNVSKDKLNISADELMQRFVRGDSSRNTEGSGLGLSIARSLTELQGGTFELYLDGDLFKVTIVLPIEEKKKL